MRRVARLSAAYFASASVLGLAIVTANTRALADDHDGEPVFLARNSWELNRTMKDWPDIQFHTTREQA